MFSGFTSELSGHCSMVSANIILFPYVNHMGCCSWDT